MTALAEAFRALGYQLSTPPAKCPAQSEVRQHKPITVDKPDFASMSDADVEQGNIFAEEEAAHIERQLQDDRDAEVTKGDEWRKRASSALTYRRTLARLWRAESNRRTQAAMVAAKRERQAAAAAQATEQAALAMAKRKLLEGQQEAAKAKAEAKQALLNNPESIAAREFKEREIQAAVEAKRIIAAERREWEATRDRNKAERFYEAAKWVLSKDQLAMIWNRADEMFPETETP